MRNIRKQSLHFPYAPVYAHETNTVQGRAGASDMNVLRAASQQTGG